MTVEAGDVVALVRATSVGEAAVGAADVEDRGGRARPASQRSSTRVRAVVRLEGVARRPPVDGDAAAEARAGAPSDARTSMVTSLA